MAKMTKDHPLVGKYLCSRFERMTLHGTRGGIVRRVGLGRKGAVTRITIQLPGNNPEGKSVSAQCRGAEVSLRSDETEVAFVVLRSRGKSKDVPLKEFLE